jgi:hypothetical protein
MRCTSPDVPASCSAISGATGLTYIPTTEDARHTIVYQNTVSDSDGETAADSQPTIELGAEGGGGSSSTTTTTTNSSSTTNNSSLSENLSNEALTIARGAANGSPASDQASLSVHWAANAHASSLKVPYKHRTRAEGRLVASDGQPIAGAVIEVIATPSSPGKAPYREGTVKTAGDGTFVLDTQVKKPSRTLTFQYRSHVNDVSLAAEAQLSLGVPVPISLSIKPRTVSRGSTIRMTGSVPGPIPSGGKQIVLQALALGVRGARWQTFNVVHTSHSGRFRASYRFRFSGPARYGIRASSRFEQDYPYLANTSKTTLVREH